MNPNNNTPTDKRNEILGAIIFFACVVSFIVFIYSNTPNYYR